MLVAAPESSCGAVNGDEAGGIPEPLTSLRGTLRPGSRQASGAAVSTLLKIMVDQTAPASTRVRAADSILDHAAKAIEIEDLEVRVSELERAAEPPKDGRRFG